ncbi:hypothetical protein COMA2_140049 [Candidatus Nitrospira nitrificans]|uniref:Uncharacterized protein n=1 Tax=Candidatus Nitrospira nitrificans TaxID=1742973 RepID=A0A0S4L928_9BACT|nr:hypothetical protein COMA2_140049 [Candidatus Nitrospira nitrificans]
MIDRDNEGGVWTAALKVACQFNDLRDRFEIPRKQNDPTGFIFPDEGGEVRGNSGAIEPYHEELADLIVRHRRTVFLSP